MLLFSQDSSDYLPVVFARHEDTECFKYSAFIYADGQTDISITGKGVLDGQGESWWNWKTRRATAETRLMAMGQEGIPVHERVFDGRNGNSLRPAFFQPMRCSNVLVEGVTFLYGAFWTITPTYCENVIIRNVHVETEGPRGHAPNGDGVDPSSSRNVLIEGCTFTTGDDCIAIKAGRDKDGMRVNKPTENIVVRDCTGRKGHGGIVVGSETAGSIRNVLATRCHFEGTDRMVRIKTQRGRGGIIENMWFRDLSGRNIQREAVHLTMLYTGTRLPVQPVTVATPQIRNIHFERISCSSGNGHAVELRGIPEMHISGITFDSLAMTTQGGIRCLDSDDVTFSRCTVRPSRGPVIEAQWSAGVSLNGAPVSNTAAP